MSLNKFFKRSLKWGLFFMASMILSHSFLAYFVGADHLWGMVTSPPSENFTPFLVIVITTLFILFNFAWFREQFCIIACPYGRAQGVLLDEHSLAVAYDAGRGEPRRKKGVENSHQGDCVNCYRCVQVCPTGIDIRRGLQMECIACTACIDACDEMMLKVKKPTGLIRYSSELGLRGKKPRLFRARSIIYFLILSTFVGALSYKVSSREALDARLIRAIESPYQLIRRTGQEALVVNHFRLAISNQIAEPMRVSMEVLDKGEASLEIVSPLLPMRVEAGLNKRVDLFFKFGTSKLEKGHWPTKVLIKGHTLQGEQRFSEVQEVNLVGPSTP